MWHFYQLGKLGELGKHKILNNFFILQYFFKIKIVHYWDKLVPFVPSIKFLQNINILMISSKKLNHSNFLFTFCSCMDFYIKFAKLTKQIIWIIEENVNFWSLKLLRDWCFDGISKLGQMGQTFLYKGQLLFCLNLSKQKSY